ncbi:DUF3119 family protein [Synechococcus sp. UW140]|uniref:DUF3119 family protein n=1 Tax=Synechococcus sp. UW140 TaxID=368503 RepID=UPI0025D9069F|nr:DUF3119 family protein [Synechococcus sp. UW140]
MANTENNSSNFTISPRAWVATGVLIISIASGIIYFPAGLVLAIFSIFLFIQTAILQLTFSADALLVTRRSWGAPAVEIKRFPYKEWQYWQIFWPRFPVLFYFREINSIHFLPMLFSANQLQSELKQRIGPSGKVDIAEAIEASPHQL